MVTISLTTMQASSDKIILTPDLSGVTLTFGSGFNQSLAHPDFASGITLTFGDNFDDDSKKILSETIEHLKNKNLFFGFYGQMTI